jgi:hypothetical protein
MWQLVALGGAGLLGACQPAPDVIVVTPAPAASQATVGTAPAAAAGTPPTASPSPSPPAAPAAAGVAAPTPGPAAPVGAPAGPAMRTVFDAVYDQHFAATWPNDPGSTAWLADGAYRLFARQPDRFVAIGAPIGNALRDVVVMAMFRKIGGPPGGGYGLIIRDQGPGPRNGIEKGGRYYVLEAGDRGEVGIWRREQDHWVNLVPWTPSEAVRRGSAANQLTVHAFGPRLMLLVNGIEAASVEDPALREGSVGVFVGGDFNEVALDWFVVRAP